MQAVNETRHQKPTRTCAGCGRHEEADAMVRLVRGPNGEIAVDAAGSAFGRGAHVHARKACVEKACRGGLAKSFKAPVATDAASLASQIVEACDRRIAGLLASAKRAGRLAVGADAACEALDEGAFAIVATNAGTVVSRGSIARAIAAGRAIAWKDKASLGALLSRNEVAVCAVSERGIAVELSKARALADAVTK
jgi:predicted RNA-binding protein YlxR (DUF448 family)